MERTSYMGMSNYAVEYIAAAKILNVSDLYKKKSRFGAPVYFLYGHGIELILKSYLMKQGKTVDEIKAYKHNLTPLYKDCVKNGLETLETEFEDVLELLDTYHRSLENRYIVTGFKVLPKPEDVQKLADLLIDRIKPEIDGFYRESRKAKTYNLTANS